MVVLTTASQDLLRIHSDNVLQASVAPTRRSGLLSPQAFLSVRSSKFSLSVCLEPVTPTDATLTSSWTSDPQPKISQPHCITLRPGNATSAYGCKTPKCQQARNMLKDGLQDQ